MIICSPNATIPLHRFCDQQNQRGSRKGKSPTLVIRLAIKPCPFSVRSIRGIHSSHFPWVLLVDPLIPCLPRAYLMSYYHSRSSSHAARSHLSGFLQLSEIG